MDNFSFLIKVALVGFFGQLVDGTLGMGYGVSCATLLVSLGVLPAVMSASIHVAELVTSISSGTSHYRLGNFRKDIFIPLVLSGILGGSLGAIGLLKLPQAPTRLLVSVILFILGGTVLYRFIFYKMKWKSSPEVHPKKWWKWMCIGAAGGFLDAMGGGGWGPVCVPPLLLQEAEPRKAIGTVNLAEFFVTLSITLTFLLKGGAILYRWNIILPLLVAGVLIAPFSAYLTHKLPPRLLGILLGLLILLLSGQTILKTLI